MHPEPGSPEPSRRVEGAALYRIKHTPPSRLLLALAAATLALALAACGGSSNSSAPTARTPTAAPTSTDAKPANVPSATHPTGNANASDEPVAFGTPDGVTLKGHLYSVAGPKRKLVILAHDATKDQRAWQPYARELAASGIAALTFDFRGFGETGGPKDIAKIDTDLTTAVRFMKSRDYAQVYVIGAGIGGTAALKVAAKEDLAGVATISAPIASNGLDAHTDVTQVTERKLFVASRGEGEIISALNQFVQTSPQPHDDKLFDGSASGTDLLTSPNAAALKQTLADFLK